MTEVSWGIRMVKEEMTVFDMKIVSNTTES